MITGIYDSSGTGLYIHVPFCYSKCAYCGFYSTVPDDGMIDEYLLHLEDEIGKRLEESREEIHTIFVGGGNPMCLGLSGLRRLAEMVLKSVAADSIREWTYEANPENLSSEVVQFLKELPGIRISIGVQRFCDAQLELLGRRARMPDVTTALELCQKHISNFGIDLILGVPQCPSLAAGLPKICKEFSIQHVSAYFLSVEPDSVLQKLVDDNKFPDPDGADPLELFEVREKLLAEGFEHYEISNYARPGRRCLHNMNYWKPGDYIGVGPAAVGTQQSLRTYNPSDLTRWLSDETPACEQLSSVDRRNEYVMLRLRLLSDGLNLASLERRFGVQEKSFYMELAMQVDRGNLVRDGNLVKLSRNGIIYADSIIAALFI